MGEHKKYKAKWKVSKWENLRQFNWQSKDSNGL